VPYSVRQRVGAGRYSVSDARCAFVLAWGPLLAATQGLTGEAWPATCTVPDAPSEPLGNGSPNSPSLLDWDIATGIRTPSERAHKRRAVGHRSVLLASCTSAASKHTR